MTAKPPGDSLMLLKKRWLTRVLLACGVLLWWFDEHTDDLDTEQDHAASRGSGLRSRGAVWAERVAEPVGGGINGDGDPAGRAGRAYCEEEKTGDAGRRADRHPRRPHDREHVLHVFRGGGDGLVVAADAVFCAWRGDGFSAEPGVQGGPFRLGNERDGEEPLEPCAGGFAMEPRAVRDDEVRVLLLSGAGTGADAWSGCAVAAGHHEYADGDPRWSAVAGVGHGDILRDSRSAQGDAA